MSNQVNDQLYDKVTDYRLENSLFGVTDLEAISHYLHLFEGYLASGIDFDHARLKLKNKVIYDRQAQALRETVKESKTPTMQDLKTRMATIAELMAPIYKYYGIEPSKGYLHTLGGKEEATDRLQSQPEEEA